MNYRDLEIWQLSRELVVEIHHMTLQKLPKFETGSLTDELLYKTLQSRLNTLGSKLNRFIQTVEVQHMSVKEESNEYQVKK